jgi:hypothetical protein
MQCIDETLHDMFDEEEDEAYSSCSSSTSIIINWKPPTTTDKERRFQRRSSLDYSSASTSTMLSFNSTSRSLTAAPSKEQKLKKSVSFGQVDIHYHEMVLGDNPYCHAGAPVEIDWKRFDHESKDIDEFESRVREEVKERIIPASQRMMILHQSGRHALGDIMTKISEIARVREQRRKDRDMYLFRRRFMRTFGTKSRWV